MELDADYLKISPKDLKRITTRVSKKMLALKKKLKFDAIVFRGNSGAAIAFPVSVATGIPVVLVRKEGSHGSKIEGSCNVSKYIILDDFISSGDTMRKILNEMTKWNAGGDSEVQCVGIALYNETSTWRKTFDYKATEIKVMNV